MYHLFSRPVGLFTLLMASCAVQKLYPLIQSHLVIFFLLFPLFEEMYLQRLLRVMSKFTACVFL